jgi:hypothetical protein
MRSKYLKVSVLGITVFSVFFIRIPSVSFHMDEALGITKSVVFELVTRGDFENPVWKNQEFTEKVVRGYFIGISRYLRGYSENDLNKSWNSRLSCRENAEAGNMPAANLLWWARFPSVLFSTLSILFICWFIERMSDTSGALVCICLFIGNKYFLDMMGRAREEAPLLGVSLLIFYSVYKAAADSASTGKLSRRSMAWLLTASLLSGLAGGLKLNGAILSLLGPVAVAPFSIVNGPRSLKFLKVIYWTCLSSILIFISFVTFVIVNPSLHRSPLKGSRDLYEHRVETIRGQLDSFPQNDMRGLNSLNRIKRITYKTFGTYAALHFRGALYIHISLFLYGIALTAVRAFRPAIINRNDPTACRVFLLGSFLASSVILIFLKLDWDRFYCIPVIFSTVFIAIGLANIYKAIAVTMRTGFKSPA